jgi:hypothetical protein
MLTPGFLAQRFPACLLVVYRCFRHFYREFINQLKVNGQFLDVFRRALLIGDWVNGVLVQRALVYRALVYRTLVYRTLVYITKAHSTHVH